MKKFLGLDDVDVKGKTVLVRVDINSPLDASKKVLDNERIREHSKTIKELSEKGAKVVVLAHQGRKGDEDFISLKEHALLISKYVGREVKFIDDVIGEKAKKAIKSMKEGEVILLENLRFLDEETKELSPEEHSRSKLVKTLSKLADIFVLDAFSASHRSHASIVGFSKILPTYAGRVMEREITSVEKALLPGNNVYVMGGAKPEDCLAVIEHLLVNKPASVQKVLACGVLGEIFLLAKGYDLGEGTKDFLESKDFMKFVPKAKELIEKYGYKIELPVDVAFEEKKKRREIKVEELPVKQMILDIGKLTIRRYCSIIKEASVVVLKGPAGVYERKGFEIGTEMILKAISSSKCFSLIGGGDTSVAIEKLGIDKKKFSFISLGGGALITYLSGEKMPGIEALTKSF